MPTKKDVFLGIKNLLDANIPEVSSRIYSSFPKKKYTLPLIVISNVSHSFGERSLSGKFYRTHYSIDVEVYTKTAQELDEISEKVSMVLRDNQVQGRYPEAVGDIDNLEFVDDNNKIIHKRTIAVTYAY